MGPFHAAELPFSVAVATDLGVKPGPWSDASHPAMLTIDEAEDLAGRLGGRLPSEAEWEAICRGGTDGLFPWGDALPADDELERWLTWEQEAPTSARNPVGFGGLFFGEWTSDVFGGEPGTASDDDEVRVIKGGGAQFWPWQDEEWVWCLPAMRMPSSDLFADGRAAARLVVDGLG